MVWLFGNLCYIPRGDHKSRNSSRSGLAQTVPRITEYNADWREKALVERPEGLFQDSGLISLQNVLSVISKGVPFDIYRKIGHGINDKWQPQDQFCSPSVPRYIPKTSTGMCSLFPILVALCH